MKKKVKEYMEEYTYEELCFVIEDTLNELHDRGLIEQPTYALMNILLDEVRDYASRKVDE